MNVRRGGQQRRNVHADHEDLFALEHDVGFLELGTSGADGLDLPALEHESRFESLLDEVVVEGLLVFGDAHVWLFDFQGPRGAEPAWPHAVELPILTARRRLRFLSDCALSPGCPWPKSTSSF
jgi:hypothetical protein